MIAYSNYKLLKSSRKTLKAISYDSANKQFLSNSNFYVIDFDNVKDNYQFANSDYKSTELRSNDALLVLNRKQSRFIFIEFKNGDISTHLKKEEIRSKISESLLILNDMLDTNLTFDRKAINYILVYNKNKNIKFETQRNSYTSKIANLLANYANESFIIDGFAKYKLFFHDVKTINEEEFVTITKSFENESYIF